MSIRVCYPENEKNKESYFKLINEWVSDYNLIKTCPICFSPYVYERDEGYKCEGQCENSFRRYDKITSDYVDVKKVLNFHQNRIYVECHYTFKDEMKKMGFQFENKLKQWYIDVEDFTYDKFEKLWKVRFWNSTTAGPAVYYYVFGIGKMDSIDKYKCIYQLKTNNRTEAYFNENDKKEALRYLEYKPVVKKQPVDCDFIDD